VVNMALESGRTPPYAPSRKGIFKGDSIVYTLEHIANNKETGGWTEESF